MDIYHENMNDVGARQTGRQAGRQTDSSKKDMKTDRHTEKRRYGVRVSALN